MEIYAKAWKLYTGEFLPDMMGEDWAAVENIACRDMYFDCVEELCHYLKTEEKFEELYRVAHSAAEIYPFYDWQIWEIDSLIGMSRYKDGLDVYKRTTKLMFEELGLSPSAGMLERFKLMGERTSQASKTSSTASAKKNPSKALTTAPIQALWTFTTCSAA